MRSFDIKESLVRKVNDQLPEITDNSGKLVSDYFAENIGCGLIDTTNLGTMVRNVNDGLSDVVKPIAALVGMLTVGNAILGVVDQILDGVGELANGLGNLLNSAVNAIPNLLDNVTGAIGDVVNGIAGTISSAVSAAGELLDRGLALFSDIGDSLAKLADFKLDIQLPSFDFNLDFDFKLPDINWPNFSLPEINIDLDNLFSDISFDDFFQEIVLPLTCKLPDLNNLLSIGLGFSASMGLSLPNISIPNLNLPLPNLSKINNDLNTITGAIDSTITGITSGIGNTLNGIKVPMPSLNMTLPSLSLSVPGFGGFSIGGNTLLGSSLNNILNNTGTPSISSARGKLPITYEACLAARKMNKYGNFDGPLSVLSEVFGLSDPYGYNQTKDIGKTTKCNKSEYLYNKDRYVNTNSVFADIGKDTYNKNESSRERYGFKEDNALNRVLGTMLENRKVMENIGNLTREVAIAPRKIPEYVDSINLGCYNLNKLNNDTVSNNYSMMEKLEAEIVDLNDSYIDIPPKYYNSKNTRNIVPSENGIVSKNGIIIPEWKWDGDNNGEPVDEFSDWTKKWL